MDIGVVGSGIIGGGFGRLWVQAGHRVRFSHSRDPARLAATAVAAGPNADTGTPEEAAAFGDAVLLALPWPLVPGALAPLAPLLAGKTLLTCVVPWGADRSSAALAVGTTTSAAEEVARLAPGAHVVAALPLLGDVLNAPTRLFPCPGGGHRLPPTVFVCGDDCAGEGRRLRAGRGRRVRGGGRRGA
jgi:predicted dinucleotide-binding enzyme